MNVSSIVKEWVKILSFETSSSRTFGILTPPKEFVKMNEILPSWDLSGYQVYSYTTIDQKSRKASCIW